MGQVFRVQEVKEEDVRAVVDDIGGLDVWSNKARTKHISIKANWTLNQ